MTHPFGYPAASSQLLGSPRNEAGSSPARATKDSAPPSSSHVRLTGRRLAELRERLSERDWELIRETGRFRVLSGAQLQRLFWPEGTPQTRERLARHGLTRLTRLDVLAPLGRTIGGVRAGSRGRCFALGIAGQRLLATGKPARRPYTPGERYLAHTLAVAELHVELVEASRWGVCKLELFQTEPAAWRTHLATFGAPATLKPDAFVKVASGEYVRSWFIERDMATESLTTIERKSRAHLDYHLSGRELAERGVAPRVAWIVPDDTRATGIEQALQRLPKAAERLFVVATADEAVATLAGGQER